MSTRSERRGRAPNDQHLAGIEAPVSGEGGGEPRPTQAGELMRRFEACSTAMKRMCDAFSLNPTEGNALDAIEAWQALIRTRRELERFPADKLRGSLLSLASFDHALIHGDLDSAMRCGLGESPWGPLEITFDPPMHAREQRLRAAAKALVANSRASDGFVGEHEASIVRTEDLGRLRALLAERTARPTSEVE